jgi:hypothetical protein
MVPWMLPRKVCATAVPVVTEARKANIRAIAPEKAIERLFMRPCSLDFSGECDGNFLANWTNHTMRFGKPT